MKEYRKVINVKATQWTGTLDSLKECEKFVGKDLDVSGGHIILNYQFLPKGYYIVQEVDGLGFYRVHPRTFEQMYEEVVVK